MAGSSFFAGVAGLKNHQLRMDVVGNNIANVNTYGFKTGRATFADILSQTYRGASSPQGGRGGTNPLQVGLGMSVFSIDNIMTQGVFETTGRATDLAVEGNGVFVVNDGMTNKYTRSGNFALDRDGILVNPQGLKVQGWNQIAVDSAGNPYVDVSGTIGELTIKVGQKMEASATTNSIFRCNLDAGTREKSAIELGDRLIDLFDGDEENVNHLGLRWGDFIEVAVSYVPDSSPLGDEPTGLPGSEPGTDVVAGATALRYFQIDNNSTIRDLQSWIQSVAEEADPANTRNVVVSVEDGLINIVNSASTSPDAVRISVRAAGGGDFRSTSLLNMRDYDVETVGVYDALLGTTPFDRMSALTRTAFNSAFSSDSASIDYVGLPWGGTIAAPLPRVVYGPTYRDVGDTLLADSVPTWGFDLGGPSRVSEDSGTSLQVLNTTWDHLQSCYVHRAAINVYDSLGGAHELQTSFYHLGEVKRGGTQWIGNAWQWNAELDYENDPYACDSLAVGPALSNYIVFQASGLLDTDFLNDSISFDASPTDADGITTASIEPNNITLTFGDIDNLIDGITQYNSESTTAVVMQDGYPMGVLESFFVDIRGDINGVFSNGLKQPLGKVALALFDNVEGLNKDGGNLWTSTANSGEARITQAGVGGAGNIYASTLEQSNVDLAQEFTNMIITQRGFQANARTITTSDEMLQELVNLKR